SVESSFQPEHIGLRETLGKLDEKYRILIEKAYFEGYTQQELEEELGIPLGTVKTRMRQAMQLLRRHLTQWACLAMIGHNWFN
ncbi:MAG: RNA polymerase sigma factor, partial [Saprospiraceae bacterium]